MKILVIAQHMQPTDGWGTLARTTVGGLTEAGHTVEVLLQGNDGLPPPLHLLDNPLLIFLSARIIAKKIRACRPDIIHVLTEPYALAFPLISRRLRHPWVVTGCGTYTILPFSKCIPSFLLQKAYADTEYVLSISTYTQKRLLAELAMRAPKLRDAVSRKISVYTLGIYPPAELPQRRDHAEKRLVFVGGVKERKGVREIIEACGELRKTSPIPFHLDVIGSCPENGYTAALRTRIGELGLTSCVTLRGQVSERDLLQAYADADLFMMLSIPHGMHFEGYGLVFLEANAFGVPVIGPNDSGCTDVIADGRSGFTVDPKQPEVVAKAMRRILEEHAIDHDTCRAWAKEHSIQRQTVETEAIYRRIL